MGVPLGAVAGMLGGTYSALAVPVVRMPTGVGGAALRERAALSRPPSRQETHGRWSCVPMECPRGAIHVQEEAQTPRALLSGVSGAS